MSRPSDIASTSLLCLVVTCLVMTSLTAADNVLMAAMQPPQRPSNFRNMGELNKYLDKLKKYYTIIGRPRFGKRAGMDTDVNPYMSSTLDSQPQVSSKLYQNPQTVYEIVSRLLRGAHIPELQGYDSLYHKKR